MLTKPNFRLPGQSGGSAPALLAIVAIVAVIALAFAWVSHAGACSIVSGGDSAV